MKINNPNENLYEAERSILGARATDVSVTFVSSYSENETIIPDVDGEREDRAG